MREVAVRLRRADTSDQHRWLAWIGRNENEQDRFVSDNAAISRRTVARRTRENAEIRISVSSGNRWPVGVALVRDAE